MTEIKISLYSRPIKIYIYTHTLKFQDSDISLYYVKHSFKMNFHATIFMLKEGNVN